MQKMFFLVSSFPNLSDGKLFAALDTLNLHCGVGAVHLNKDILEVVWLPELEEINLLSRRVARLYFGWRWNRLRLFETPRLFSSALNLTFDVLHALTDWFVHSVNIFDKSLYHFFLVESVCLFNSGAILFEVLDLSFKPGNILLSRPKNILGEPFSFYVRWVQKLFVPSYLGFFIRNFFLKGLNLLFTSFFVATR